MEGLRGFASERRRESLGKETVLSIITTTITLSGIRGRHAAWKAGVRRWLRLGGVGGLCAGAFLAGAEEALDVHGHEPPGLVLVQELQQQWSISLRWENDKFGGTDRFYTDGLSLSVAHTGPSWLDSVADWLPWGEGRRTVGYDLSQIMITPEDISLTVPDPNDRPYAGILSLGLTLHVERRNSYHGFKVITGVVGPWSLAGEAQRSVHRLGGWVQPNGWDYQLENEPILNLFYEYRHRFRLAGSRSRHGWTLEALPIAGAWLGNVLTEGQVGGLVRAGYDIPNDFGATLVRGMGHLPPPSQREYEEGKSDWGFAVYAGALCGLVLRDITLDGNTFVDGPSVERIPIVPMAGVGASVGNRRFQTSFSYIYWGDEFEAQREPSKFGSVTFCYFF